MLQSSEVCVGKQDKNSKRWFVMMKRQLHVTGSNLESPMM